MTASPELNATIALRKPDGARFGAADVEGLMASTLLVIEIDARAATDTDHGEPVVTIGRVIGWVPPVSADLGRTMLLGACQATNSAAEQLATIKAQAGEGNGRHAK